MYCNDSSNDSCGGKPPRTLATDHPIRSSCQKHRRWACRRWAKALCRFGENCPFKHDKSIPCSGSISNEIYIPRRERINKFVNHARPRKCTARFAHMAKVVPPPNFAAAPPCPRLPVFSAVGLCPSNVNAVVPNGHTITAPYMSPTEPHASASPSGSNYHPDVVPAQTFMVDTATGGLGSESSQGNVIPFLV